MEKRRVQLTTRLNGREKRELEKFARTWGVSSAAVFRRLIHFFSEGKISILELIKRTDSDEMDLPEKKEKIYALRITLSEFEREKFLLNASKEWDFSISSLLRRLLRALIVGKISRNDLWEISE